MSPTNAFHFQQFSIEQDQCAMKVGIDSVCLGAWCPTPMTGKILDIGTGSGLLALMLAQKTTQSIDAIEINEAASIQAKSNISNSPYSEQITVYHRALQEFHPQGKYSLIISNPPYFNNSLKADTPERTLARHNDKLSLEDLFEFVAKHLENEGQLALILPYATLSISCNIAKEWHLYPSHLTQIIGKEGKMPNRILIRFKKHETHYTQKQLIIRDSAGSFTNDFKCLTKDFYRPSIFR